MPSLKQSLVTSTLLQLLNRFLGHEYGVTSVRFSPSGRVLASCSWDDNIGLWDMHTGTLVGWLRGHTSPVATCVFLEGGSVLVSIACAKHMSYDQPLKRCALTKKLNNK